jgi:probable HAF family extracellular repeat protein
MQHLRIATVLLFGIVVFGSVETAFADNAYTFTRFDVPGSTVTCAFGINDSGQIVGALYDGTTYHGFLYSGGSFTTIDVPGATGNTAANGINNSGQIVGCFETAQPPALYGFLATPKGRP